MFVFGRINVIDSPPPPLNKGRDEGIEEEEERLTQAQPYDTPPNRCIYLQPDEACAAAMAAQ